MFLCASIKANVVFLCASFKANVQCFSVLASRLMYSVSLC